MEIEMQAWNHFAEIWATPYTPRFDRGPWSGTYVPPFTRRTSRVQIAPVAPRTAALDYEAYMSSVDHLARNFWGGVDHDEASSGDPWWFGTGIWPTPDLTPDAGNLDAMGCWTMHGRNQAYSFAALTPDGTKQLGCTYFWSMDGDDPYEAANRLWVRESELATDLDRHLLEETLAWVEEEWEFNRILVCVPRIYERGLEIAAAAGLQEVDRKAALLGGQERPDEVCFRWERP
jgi:hypothetical protein